MMTALQNILQGGDLLCLEQLQALRLISFPLGEWWVKPVSIVIMLSSFTQEIHLDYRYRLSDLGLPLHKWIYSTEAKHLDLF